MWLANTGMTSFGMVGVQAVLQSDKGMGSLPGGSLNFERWIKHGLMADDLLNSSNDSEELLLQGLPLLFLWLYCT